MRRMFFFYKVIISHLLKEILPICLLILSILTILVLCQQIARNSELFFSPLINSKFSLQILVSLLPPILIFTLPISIVLGEIIAFSRMAADHEWTALQACGLNKTTRLGPFLFVGLLGFIFILLLNWSLGPKTVALLKDVRKIVSIKDIASLIQPQIFISEFPGVLLKVSAVDKQTGKLDKVLLLTKSENPIKFQLLAAKSGNISSLTNDSINSFEIKLSNGVIIDNFTSEKNHITSTFKENTIKVRTTKYTTQDPSADLLSSVQLSSMDDLLAKLKQIHPRSATQALEFEIFKRLTNAFACLFASLCALVITTKSHGRSVKRLNLLLLSFLLLVIYQASLTLGQNLSYKGILPTSQAVLLSLSIPFLGLAITYVTISQEVFVNTAGLRFLIKSLKSINIFTRLFRTISHVKSNKNLPNINFGHYIITYEFAKLLILSSFILTTTILSFTLLDIAPSITKNNITANLTIRYLLRFAPQIIYYITPFGVLIAIVSTGVTLARTGQLSILLYYSANPLRLAFPVILGTILLYLTIIFMSETFLPRTNREQDNLYRIIKGKTTEDSTVALDYQWLSNENSDIIYGFRAFEEHGIKKLTILAIKLLSHDYYLSEILYMTGLDIQRRIIEGQHYGLRYEIGKDGLAEFTYIDPVTLLAELNKIEGLPQKTYREANKMSIKQLQQYISQVEHVGLPATSLRMDKIQKIAFPFTCITMLFMAFPLCLLQLRKQYQSSFITIAISIGLALLFWGILSVFEAAGKRGALPIIIAAWSPHAMFLALASTIQVKLP